jgi:hypothetical protein
VFAVVVFRPRASQGLSANLLPQFTPLSEYLSRDRVEASQGYHADLPEQLKDDWPMPEPISDLAFIERRLVDFDRNRREQAVKINTRRKFKSGTR